jgi:predicted CXXCH cytochrome family protein
MIPPVTGRERASRIPLDYFKTPSLWERRKWLITVIAVVAVAAWWTAGVLLGRQNGPLHSPGSLASVHHTWESNCTACHADFCPIRDDAVSVAWESGTPESDQKCQACHRGAEHHPVKKGSIEPGCSACHQDHQGVQASLLRMDDWACTRCHEAIDQHVAGKPTLPSDAGSVTRFDKEHHPEFASAKKDPGHLKFSHFRHLTPGLVNDVRDDKTVWTLARISDPLQRERYRRPGQSDDAAVQLDCESCHQLDGGDFHMPHVVGISEMMPARAPGSYMLPITYENQCQACHRLYDEKEPGVLPAIVRHGQSPKEIEQALHQEFVEQYLQGQPGLLQRSVPPEPLPNIRPPGAETVEQAIQEKVQVAELKLAQEYCGKCHEPAGAGPGLQPVVPPQIPQVWFQHARFDHRAHRAMDCRECHAGAYPDSPQPSRESKDVLIPQRDVCLKCHSPPSQLGSPSASQSGSATAGGARFDCAECHRYHNGAAPLAGSGAKAGDPLVKLNQEEFQAGGASEQGKTGPK